MTDFIEKVQNGELSGRSATIRETHTATAQVGKDTIEAEYFTFDLSLGLNEPDWTIWDKITMPFYRVKNWTRDTYWEIRYGFQRMFRGYDEVDVFETFAKFIDRYTKILTRLRNNHWGHPYNLTEEEWDTVIDEMIYHLKYMDEETVTEELERNVPNGWAASSKTVYEILEKHKDQFFELFSKYFFDLWD